MNNIQIPEKGIYKEYAGAWDEILPKDAPYIGKCLYMADMKQISVDMFRKLVVDRLIGRVNNKRMPVGVKAMNMWANEGQLADTVNFFFKITKQESSKFQIPNFKEGSADLEPETLNLERETYEVIPNFVKNLVPYVICPLRLLRTQWAARLIGPKYYGPGDFLEDVTMAEFKDLLYCSNKWMQTKDEYWLNRMMAISYRRKQLFLGLKKLIPSFKYEKRIRYNSTRVDFRIKKFEKLDIGAKYMFFYYVMGCMYMLKTDAEGAGIEIDGNICNFSVVFDKKEDDSSTDSESTGGVGLSGLIMAIAESGVFGNVDATSDTNVWTFFVRLYQLELQRRDFEKKMKSSE